ncbi:hypothetical protein RF55_20074, partial [Lasius niger]
MLINKDRIMRDLVNSLQSSFDMNVCGQLSPEEKQVFDPINVFLNHVFDNDEIDCLKLDPEDPADYNEESEDEEYYYPVYFDCKIESIVENIDNEEADLTYHPPEKKSKPEKFNEEKVKRISQTIKQYPNSNLEWLAKRLKVSKRTISNYKNRLHANSSIIELYRILDERLFARFCDLREAGALLRDHDLRQLSLEIAQELAIPIEKFVASPSWLVKFKNRHRIKKRKITHFYTHRQLMCLDEIQKAGTDYVNQVNSILPRYKPEFVFNCDQSGFQREIHRNITLEIKRSKNIYGKVHNLNALTHSYTIMPLIKLSGELGPKLYIVIQEPKGQFSPTYAGKINDLITSLGNVVVTCTTSGKMGNKELHQYLNECFWPYASEKEDNLLNIDSWTPFTKDENFTSPQGTHKTVTKINIPPKTTYERQPLDRQFFRTYKAM